MTQDDDRDNEWSVPRDGGPREPDAPSDGDPPTGDPAEPPAGEPPPGAAREGPPGGANDDAQEPSGENEEEVDPEAIERHIDELLGDASLQSLMQSGEYAEFRSRLHERESRASDPARIAAIQWALANPGEFAEPLRSAPALGDFRGIGTNIYGRDQFDSATGLYLTTLFFTIFWVPILPLGRYLIRETGDTYVFHAKVDPASYHQWWRGGLAFAVVAATGAVAYGIATYQPDVRFINGLDHPVEVRVEGEETVDVPPHSVAVEDIPAGTQTFVSRYAPDVHDQIQHLPEDGVIERHTSEIPQFSDLVAYNVGGLAPAYIQSVTYYSETSGVPVKQKMQREELRPLAGKTLYADEDVDYVDTEPPKEIEMAEDVETEKRWAFRYDGEGPAMSDWMLQNWAHDRRAAFLRRAVELRPHHEWFYRGIETVMMNAADRDDSGTLVDWLDFVQGEARDHPTLPSLHWFYATQARKYAARLDRPTATEAYREHHRSADTPASALTLAYVTPSRPEARKLVGRVREGVSENNPLAAAARWFQGSLDAGFGTCESATEHFADVYDPDRHVVEQYLKDYAICLAATGDSGRALEVLRRHANPDSPTVFQLARTFGRVALEGGGSEDPFGLLREAAEKSDAVQPNEDLRMSLGLRMGYPFDTGEIPAMKLTKEGENYARLYRALSEGPSGRLDAFTSAPQLLNSVDSGLRMLAFLEAYIHGDPGTVQAFADRVGIPKQKVETALQLGGDQPSFADTEPGGWPPPERAAWHIARAATLSDPEAKANALQRAEEAQRVHSPLTLVVRAQRSQLE